MWSLLEVDTPPSPLKVIEQPNVLVSTIEIHEPDQGHLPTDDQAEVVKPTAQTAGDNNATNHRFEQPAFWLFF